MVGRLTYRSVIVLFMAGLAAGGLSGPLGAALTGGDGDHRFPASGYFLNPCTQEIVAYNGYVHVRPGKGWGGDRHKVHGGGQALKGYGTTTGDTYMITIGPGRTVTTAGGRKDRVEQLFKVDGMNVIHVGRGAADEWIVDDATILAITSADGFHTVAEFVINDNSCD